MRNEYDFKHSKKNPYAKLLKKQITIRLDVKTVEYFKVLAKQIGVAYQQLIDLYLRDCVESKKKVSIKWGKT
jgi:uncharacterized protein (DUF4415 family)